MYVYKRGEKWGGGGEPGKTNQLKASELLKQLTLEIYGCRQKKY